MLALASTTAFAQVADQAPPPIALPQDVESGSPLEISAPDVTAPQPVASPAATGSGSSASQPTIVLPDFATEAAEAAPVATTETVTAQAAEQPADAAPADTAPASVPATTSSEQRENRAPAAESSAPTTAAAENDRTAAPEPIVPTENNIGTAADGALAAGNAFPPADASPVTDEQSSGALTDGGDNDFLLEGAIALLLGLGLAGAAILAIRSRRKKGGGTEPATVSGVAPAAGAAPAWSPMPVKAPAEARVQTPAAARAIPSASEDRQAVLERMVAAPPDKENPFTSRKARRRRARILLQHRERQQAQESGFDWRTYSSREKPAVPAYRVAPEVAKV